MKAFKSTLLFLLSFLFSQELSFNESDKMLNAFVMGMDEKAMNIALEIISDEKYIDQREYVLFTLSEYFFHNAIKNDDFNTAQRAYTFYTKFFREYPNSDKGTVAQLRINFLSSIFVNLKLSGEYLSQIFSQGSEVMKIGQLGTSYTSTKDKISISKAKMLIDTDAAFEVANKYYDTIILNYPEFSSYGYYLKILSYLNHSSQWGTAKWMIDSGIDKNAKSGKKDYGKFWGKSYEKVYGILKTLRKSDPQSDLTLDAHVMLATTVWNTGLIMSKASKKAKVQQILQYVLTNDKNQIGYRYMIVKEFVIRNL